MHSIAVAGHLCLDSAPRLGSTAVLEPGRLFEVGPLAISLGRSVANTGRALVDLGATVTPFASIGDDELGRLLLAKLHDERFAEPQLSTSPGSSTSYSIVFETPGTDRTFWHHTGANDELTALASTCKGRTFFTSGTLRCFPACSSMAGILFTPCFVVHTPRAQPHHLTSL